MLVGFGMELVCWIAALCSCQVAVVDIVSVYHGIRLSDVFFLNVPP